MRTLILAIVVALAGIPAAASVDIEEVTTPGGIHAWLVEAHGIPFVSLEIRFRGGGSLDRPGKRGATNLMSGLLEEGAGDLDSRGFAKASEALAASFDYATYDDSVAVSASFLAENEDRAIDLLRSSLVEPTFAPKALERVRGQVLSVISSDHKDPNWIAGATFDRLAFGDHPYGSDLNGTAASVKALTRDDIVQAWKGALARDRLYVSAVGDITPEELAPMLDHLLGDLPARGAPMPGDADYGLGGGTTLVPYQTPQSVAIFGQEGIDQSDPDFFALYILNTILGGDNFESRLMHEVREKRGLTYGVYTYPVSKDHAAMILGTVASANDKIADAIEVIREQWAKIATGDVTAQELEDAKTYLTGAYPLRFDGNAPIANILVGMQMEGLPRSYVKTRNDKIEAVSLDQINAVARKLMKPKQLHFVVVGKPEGLQGADVVKEGALE